MRLDRHRRHGRSTAQASIGQALSAASNFVILLALAHGGGSSAVGEFALAFVVYNAALGLQRSAVNDALLARPADDRTVASRTEARAATSSLLLATAIALVVLAVGMITTFHQLRVLALFLPALLLEDLYRYLLFRRGRIVASAAVDAVWALCSCIGFAVLLVHPTGQAAVLIWGLGGTVAAATGWVVCRTPFAGISESRRWWRQQMWRSSRWLTLEAVLFHCDQELLAFGFTATAGAALFGEWQIAQSLFGISIFLNAGLRMVSVTYLSSAEEERTEADEREAAVVASLVSAGFTALLTIVLLAVAPVLIPWLFGDKAVVPESTILVTGAFFVVAAAGTGPVAYLRALHTERPLPVARAVALVGFSPIAVLVARHHFTAALWIVAAGALAYVGVVTWAMFHVGRAIPLEQQRAGSGHELAA